MSTILFAWELGGGLGHVTRIRPLAERLHGRGHRVVVAARDTKAATRVFHDTCVECIQAPFATRRPDYEIKRPLTYAHILHNVGFADFSELSTQVGQWRQLFERIQPDAIAFDHSPTALLAARHTNARRILFGDGFCCPPDTSPLPNLRPWLESDPNKMFQQEQRTLSVANNVLLSSRQRPLDRLADLYGDCDDMLLTTFSELDHFPRNQNPHYFGAWPSYSGKDPEWPKGRGKRVFAYLKSDAHVGFVFELLRISGLPTIVYVDGISPAMRQRHEGGSLRFADSPLDLTRVSTECDFAILNATHGATAAFLLAGKPILQLPIYLEQSLTARNTVRLGAGLAAIRNKPDEVAFAFRRMIDSDEFDHPSAAFAARYSGVEAVVQEVNQVARIEKTILNGQRCMNSIGLAS